MNQTPISTRRDERLCLSATVHLPVPVPACACVAACVLARLAYLFPRVYFWSDTRHLKIKVGNQAFATFAVSQGVPVYRVVHHRDPVPHVPFEAWGYRHPPTEVFFDADQTSYMVCDDTGEDLACSDQFWVRGYPIYLHDPGWRYDEEPCIRMGLMFVGCVRMVTVGILQGCPSGSSLVLASPKKIFVLVKKQGRPSSGVFIAGVLFRGLERSYVRPTRMRSLVFLSYYRSLASDLPSPGDPKSNRTKRPTQQTTESSTAGRKKRTPRTERICTNSLQVISGAMHVSDHLWYLEVDYTMAYLNCFMSGEGEEGKRKELPPPDGRGPTASGAAAVAAAAAAAIEAASVPQVPATPVN